MILVQFSSGSLDSFDVEYYTKCINKISRDEHDLENFMKSKISVTTSVIKKLMKQFGNYRSVEKHLIRT